MGFLSKLFRKNMDKESKDEQDLRKLSIAELKSLANKHINSKNYDEAERVCLYSFHREYGMGAEIKNESGDWPTLYDQIEKKRNIGKEKVNAGNIELKKGGICVVGVYFKSDYSNQWKTDKPYDYFCDFDNVQVGDLVEVKGGGRMQIVKVANVRFDPPHHQASRRVEKIIQTAQPSAEKQQVENQYRTTQLKTQKKEENLQEEKESQKNKKCKKPQSQNKLESPSQYKEDLGANKSSCLICGKQFDESDLADGKCIDCLEHEEVSQRDESESIKESQTELIQVPEPIVELLDEDSVEENITAEELFGKEIFEDKETKIIESNIFKKDLENLPEKKKEKILEHLRDLSTLSVNEIRERLNARNSKKFKNIGLPVFKYKWNNAERIIYTYGKALKIENEIIKDGDIVFLAYVIIHDKQEDIAQNAVNQINFKKVDLTRFEDQVQNAVTRSLKDNKFVPTLFYLASDFPLLSIEQQQYIKLQPPLIFRGSAGSGKTILSIEFYKKLEKDYPKIGYITFTDNMKNHAYKMLKNCGIKEPHCFTLDEFCNTGKSNLLFDPNPQDYIKITNKQKKEYPRLTEQNVYTYIRGIIKGRSDKKDKGFMPLEKFISHGVKEELSKDEIQIVHDVALEYQKQLKKNNRCDDNDLALQLLDAPQSYDCLIIDEVQDLTELQIKAIIKCCPANNLLFFGDPNQVINPTIFNFGKINNIFHEMKQEIKIEQHVLKRTWRSGEYLIKYINGLTELRKEFIAKQDYLDDAEEESMRKDADETFWACYSNNPETVDRLLDVGNKSASCIIIVNDVNSRESLVEKKSNLKGRVLTVQQIKGLEYKNVILYNLISDNEKSFYEIFSKKAKRSTPHRMVFNKYYVSCTRAEDSIFICENKPYDKLIFEKLFKEQNITVNNDIGTLLNHISITQDKESWVKEGIKLKENKNYKEAQICFLRGEDMKGYEICEMCIECEKELQSSKNKSQTETLKIKSDYAYKFLHLEEFEIAKDLYKIHEPNGETIANICAGHYVDRGKIIKAINEFKVEPHIFNKVMSSNIVNYFCEEVDKLNDKINKLKEIS